MSFPYLSAYTMTSALGRGLASTLEALRAQRSGLQPTRWETVDLDTCIGEVPALDDVLLPPDLLAHDCRNNRLAFLALQQDGFHDAVQLAIADHGVGRVGVFLGTSTSGIHTSEVAYRHRDPGSGAILTPFDYRRTHNTYSLADFVRTLYGLRGPAVVISTACSSSAKVFGHAQRLMDLGLIDAAIVGGVDSLCLTTLYGFNSLQLVSAQPCRPYDAQRDGISIGEAAALVLLERQPRGAGPHVVLRGVGESSDAHHMSAPHPQGQGARAAMQAALDSAGLRPADIGYINLHGTSTPSNDAAEDLAVSALFGTTTPCSSTKGHTGHTLGAAGGVEAVISALALAHGLAPGGCGTKVVDPQLRSRYLLDNEARPLRHVLSNSFGFGGSNCSLVFSREDA